LNKLITWEDWLLERTIPLVITIKIFTFSRYDRGRFKDFQDMKSRYWEIKIYFLIWIRKYKDASRWYRRRYLITLIILLFSIFLALIISLTVLWWGGWSPHYFSLHHSLCLETSRLRHLYTRIRESILSISLSSRLSRAIGQSP